MVCHRRYCDHNCCCSEFLVGAFLLGIVLIVFAGVYLLYDVNIHPEVYVNIDTSGVKINVKPMTILGSVVYIVKIDNKPMMMRFKTTIKTVGDVNIYIKPCYKILTASVHCDTPDERVGD